MNERPSDRLAIAVAQLDPTVGDIAGNADKARARPRRGGARRRRPDRAARAVPLRLPARGSGAQAGPAGGLPQQDRGAGARDRRRRPRHADRHPLGGGGQALQRLLPARPRQHRGPALQGRSAELRRVRREAGVRARPDARPGQFPRRAPGPADLRGYLGHRRGRDPGGDRRRDADRAQRLALLARQGDHAAQHRGRPRHRERPADGLCQPGRRPGRADFRRRFVRPARGLLARLPAARLRRERDDGALAAHRQRLALPRGPHGQAAGERAGRLCGLRAGPAGLCGEERLQRRGAGALGRGGFGAVRRAWRSMRWAPSACAA